MGFFGKKKSDYEEASNQLNNAPKAVDRIIVDEMIDDDKRAAQLVDELKKGNPLVLNFGNLEPTAANKLLAFFAGACYAIEGRCVTINENTFLFARKTDFLDGSLQTFLDQIPE